MSELKAPEPVKLLVSCLAPEPVLIAAALVALSNLHGGIDFVSAVLPFEETQYYAREMGSGLKRRFASFAPLIDPGSLPDIKHSTNALEGRFAVGGARRVNIDPGYLSPAHLILATGKGYSHRPYLRDGVYADLTLLYERGTFRACPWTYPDYTRPEVIAMFNILRKRYLLQRRLCQRQLSAGQAQGREAS